WVTQFDQELATQPYLPRHSRIEAGYKIMEWPAAQLRPLPKG
ncbi:MAG: hypothetical protein QOI34_1238, partial [Verrucomicrobiota bacterium]